MGLSKMSPLPSVVQRKKQRKPRACVHLGSGLSRIAHSSIVDKKVKKEYLQQGLITVLQEMELTMVTRIYLRALDKREYLIVFFLDSA